MSDEIWARDEIDSPCQKLCVIHPVAKLCIGCLRTGEEIAAWSQLSATERQRIMAVLPDRAALIIGKRRRRGSAPDNPRKTTPM